MRCHRCQGTMVLDYFLDLDSGGELWMRGWRCLICGEVVDFLILNHRRLQQAPASSRKKARRSTPRRANPQAVVPGSGKIRKPKRP
ncbi:MAG: hypothetical protein D6690_11565 [Nitrospirae bacterium]|nr:MAG: hypothetical protein D6690_11565 [Nitrospirota bacterium]